MQLKLIIALYVAEEVLKQFTHEKRRRWTETAETEVENLANALRDIDSEPEDRNNGAATNSVHCVPQAAAAMAAAVKGSYSEPEMMLAPNRAASGDVLGDNWTLKESPLYRSPYRDNRLSRSLEEGMEVEISREEEHRERPASARVDILNHRIDLTLSQVHRWLGQADADLADAQDDLLTANADLCVIEADALAANVAKLAEDVADMSVGLSPPLRTSSPHPEPRSRPPVIVELQSCRIPSTSPNYLEAIARGSALFASVTSTAEEDADDEEEDDSWGGAFSLSQSLYPSASRRGGGDETTVRLLTRERVAVLAGRLGLPPGLRPFLELEVARLQLGAVVFRHRTITCDRACVSRQPSLKIFRSFNHTSL